MEEHTERLAWFCVSPASCQLTPPRASGRMQAAGYGEYNAESYKQMARSLEIDPARTRGAAMMRELLRTMRPKEWIKNVFVFAAIAFARDTDTGLPLWQELNKVLI